MLFLQTSVGRNQSSGSNTLPHSAATNVATEQSDFYPELIEKKLVINLNSSATKSTTVPQSSKDDRICGKSPNPTSTDVSASSSSTSVIVSNFAVSDEWTVVESRTNKNNVNKAIVGVRNAENFKIEAVSDVRSWYCKISRVNKSISTDNVKEHMRDMDICVISVEALRSWNANSQSMHTEVPYDDKDKVIQSSFWPKGIYVSGWKLIFGARKNQRLNSLKQR